MDRIVFDENKKMYRVYYKNKTFSYSISRYGKFAVKLAKKSLATGIKYFDYYRIYNDIAIFFIYTKAYGVKKIIFDKGDINIVNKSKISISKDNHAKTFYASNKESKIHRLVMGLSKGDNLIIDHINRNGLDNRKSNLRIVSTSINNRNSNIRKTNIFNCRGITEDEKRIRCYWYGLDKKKYSKSFSKKKYGREQAIELAIKYRKEMELENGYL